MTARNGSAAPWTGQIVVLIPAHNEEESISTRFPADLMVDYVRVSQG
jgi:hypothetical protein